MDDVSIKRWLDDNLKKEDIAQGVFLPWNILFATTVWCIWLNRNDLLFRNADTNHVQIAIKSNKMAYGYFEAFNSNVKEKVSNYGRLINWKFPAAGLIKINTDGSVMEGVLEY